MSVRLSPGSTASLGATWDGRGVNFAVFSEDATSVELCLFDRTGSSQEQLPLARSPGGVWSMYVGGIGPGKLYGFRANGPYAPKYGLRFNHSKLLLDPYARAIAGRTTWGAPMYDFVQGCGGDLDRSDSDSAPNAPRSVVVDNAFKWKDDSPPRTPLSDTVIYETHVKGLTRLHPDVPHDLRGTYAGLARPPIIEHLKSLGVTAVELLPVQEFADDEYLLGAKLANYFGYQPIGHFAPAARYSSSGDRGGQAIEFKKMVRALHEARLEVILDVVYNHTLEVGRRGPTFSFRGLDNPVYYVLQDGDNRDYVDVTGVGNTCNVAHPAMLEMVIDNLRYWVQEMHVDGFRFDLASVLGLDRSTGSLNFDRASRFFAEFRDPAFEHVKLIAEPWASQDFPQFFELGNFPRPWSEWNSKYSDSTRRFWKGDDDQIRDLAYGLTGSCKVFAPAGLNASASVNYVTVHDGFTLRDVVSYTDRDQKSWGCRMDGKSDRQTEDLRARQQRNFLATLFVSLGVPLLQGGSELGRTQYGNPNAYDQDNRTSWYNWDLNVDAQELVAFTRQVIALRKEHPVLRRMTYFQGEPAGSDLKDVTWLRPDGIEMGDEDWRDASARALGMRIAGDAADPDEAGRRPPDVPVLVLLNAWWERMDFVLPSAGVACQGWELELDTNAAGTPVRASYSGGQTYAQGERSMSIMRGIPAQLA